MKNDTKWGIGFSGAKWEIMQRILRYFMMVILLTAAFLLPGEQKKMKEDRIGNGNYTGEKPIAEEKGTIVLDPGHGGFDGGMTGKSGISEKVLNLIYAQKLAVLLEQEGFCVVLTRNTDAGLYDETSGNKKAQDMQRRCAIIEKVQPLLTISIHQNSYPQDSSVRGPQVFYYKESAEGEKLAECIQSEMNEQLKIARPRMKKANENYYILKHSAGTAVLVEVGFLTNPEEEQLLQQEEYQNRVVRAMADAVLKYQGTQFSEKAGKNL